MCFLTVLYSDRLFLEPKCSSQKRRKFRKELASSQGKVMAICLIADSYKMVRSLTYWTSFLRISVFIACKMKVTTGHFTHSYPISGINQLVTILFTLGNDWGCIVNASRSHTTMKTVLHAQSIFHFSSG